MKTVCLAVLNFNGRKHLEILLPTAIASAKKCRWPCSVLVLDNRSSDDDVAWLRHNFPSVKTVVAPENGFLFSYNWLLPEITEDIVVILNNDLRLSEDFVAPLLRHFHYDDVFAVSASSYDWEGCERTIGPAYLIFEHGFYKWPYEPSRQSLCHTLFASGGFMAVDRKKFIELGGFNRLFFPAYCEDLDLCFRAWSRGWRSIYEPESIVWHRESASWNVSSTGRPKPLCLRHALFFQWSSLPMNRQRLARWYSTAKLVVGGVVRGDRTWMEVLPRAWRDWCKLRAQYISLKIADEHLATIQEAIKKPVPEPPQIL